MIKMKIKAREAKKYGSLIWEEINDDRTIEREKQICRLVSNRRFFGFRKPMTIEEATARVDFEYYWGDEIVQWQRLNRGDGFSADQLISAASLADNPEHLIEIDEDLINCIAIYDINKKFKDKEKADGKIAELLSSDPDN